MLIINKKRYHCYNCGNIFTEDLNIKGIYVSTKTSCCPIETPSKLVYAVTKNKGLASYSIRLSLSHLTTDAEIDEFMKVFKYFIEN